MSDQENKAFIRRYLEASSGKDRPRTLQDEYITEADEELKNHIIFFEASFPHYEVIADDMIAEGDKVAVLAGFRGGHKGGAPGHSPHRQRGRRTIRHHLLSRQRQNQEDCFRAQDWPTKQEDKYDWRLD